MCWAENKCSINSTHCHLLLLPLQAMRGAQQDKARVDGRALNAERRTENFACSPHWIVHAAQWRGDYNYTLFTDGLKVQRSRNFAWGHTAGECSWAGMLRFREVQSEGTSGPHWCSDYPRRSHHSTNSTSLTQRQLGSEVSLWHHHPNLWILQGRRSIMEGLEPKCQIQKPIWYFLVTQPPGGLSLFLIKNGNL